MIEYVSSNTPLKDPSKYFCKKLVKKDLDLTKLTYMAFRIDVTEDDFGVINNPDYWPTDTSVRAFIRVENPTPRLFAAIPSESSSHLPLTKTKRLRSPTPTDLPMDTAVVESVSNLVQ